MTLSPAQLDSLLRDLRIFLPAVEWAPDQSWAEDGKPYCFANECQCNNSDDRDPANLTLFLRTSGEPGPNVVQRLVDATRAWARASVMFITCASCHHKPEIEVYLFQAGI